MTSTNTSDPVLNDAATFRLPLSNRPGRYVTFCQAGRDLLIKRGVGNIFMNNAGCPRYSYVYCYNHDVAGQIEAVARVLMGAGRGQCVRYHDGDVTNLRLANLHLTRGAAKGQSLYLGAFSGDAA